MGQEPEYNAPTEQAKARVALGEEAELLEGGAGSLEVGEFHPRIFTREDDAVGIALEGGKDGIADAGWQRSGDYLKSRLNGPPHCWLLEESPVWEAGPAGVELLPGPPTGCKAGSRCSTGGNGGNGA